MYLFSILAWPSQRGIRPSPTENKMRDYVTPPEVFVIRSSEPASTYRGAHPITRSDLKKASSIQRTIKFGSTHSTYCLIVSWSRLDRLLFIRKKMFISILILASLSQSRKSQNTRNRSTRWMNQWMEEEKGDRTIIRWTDNVTSLWRSLACLGCKYRYTHSWRVDRLGVARWVVKSIYRIIHGAISK